MMCAACAVDGDGFVFADVYNAHGATVVHLRTLGAQIRSRPDDGGATLGVSDRLYVFARTPEIPPGRYWFHVPFPAASNGLAVISFALGVDLLVRAPEIDLALGLSQHVLMARVPAGASVARTVELDLTHPERTMVHICEWRLPC
jgi:hypothetical protein